MKDLHVVRAASRVASPDVAGCAAVWLGQEVRREQGELERGFFETVVSDLERIPPRLPIVDRSRDQQGMAYGRPFDFLCYFSSSPRFVEVMTRYRRVGTLGSYEVYERVR